MNDAGAGAALSGGERLEAAFEIEQLVRRYFVACDDKDDEALGAVFCSEAAFGEIHGRTEIVARLHDQQARMGRTVHTGHGVVFGRLESAHADGLVVAHCELARDDTTQFGVLRYHDDYCRSEGRWLICRRTIETVHLGPWSDVDRSLFR